MDDVVDFDGLDRPRKLRVDVNSVSDFEYAAGMSIFEALSGDRLRLSTIRDLMWATMKQDDKKLTRERMGTMMNEYLANGGHLQALADAVVEAVNKSRLMIALSGASPNGQAGPPTTATSPQASETGSQNG